MQVRGFWAQLEAATNERQQAMFRVLNKHLARLAQRVETVVGDLLEVCALPLHAIATTSMLHRRCMTASGACECRCEAYTPIPFFFRDQSGGCFVLIIYA